MRKKLLASFFFAFCVCICARAEATPWFVENAESFYLNAAHCWRFTPGVAQRQGDEIVVHYVDELSAEQLEVKYVPQTPTASSVVSNVFEAVFNEYGDDVATTGGALAGVQLVRSSEGLSVFAVHTPATGDNGWLITSVAGELHRTYRFTVIITTGEGGGYVRYVVDDETGAPQLLAEVSLPEEAKGPKEFVLFGEISARQVAAWHEADADDRYLRWQRLGGVFTWRDGSTVVDGLYDVFDVRRGVDLGLSVATGLVFSAAGGGQYSVPGSAIRFTAAASVAGGASPLHFGGMIVESGADGLSLTANELRFGDASAAGKSYFSFDSSANLGAGGAQCRFYGDCTLAIAEGKTVDMSGAAAVVADPATSARLHLLGDGTLKLPVLNAAGAVTLDYSKVGAGFRIQGDLVVNAATAFRLPESVASGEEFALCSGTVSGAPGGRVERTIEVGDRTLVAEVEIVGSKVVYYSRSYADWSAFPAVFTWAGGSALANGVFRLFESSQGSDSSRVFRGGEPAANVPGWGDGVFRDFRSVFRDNVGGGFPLCRASGYVLRLPPGAGGPIDIADGSPVFGGLLVEPGAVGYSFGGAVRSAEILRFGASSAVTTNRIEIAEDLEINRTSSVEFSGRSSMHVEANRTLRINGVRQDLPVGARKGMPYLSFSGEGRFQCNGMSVSGASTLDFSALPPAAAEPFVDGALEVSPGTRLVLPEGLAASVQYPLCSGRLVMDGGVRAVAFGADEFKLVNLAVSGASGKVSWSAATVNERTLSAATYNWSQITGLVAGRPLVLTLTRDVRLTMNSAGVSIPALLVLGGHRLSIVMKNDAEFGDVFVGRSSSCEYVYYFNSASDKSASFGAELSVPCGAAYDTVIEGTISGDSAVWAGPISVNGLLKLRNHLVLTNEASMVDNIASLVLDAGADVVLGGVTNTVGGRVEVASGAALHLVTDNLFCSDGSPMELAVGGLLDLGLTSQTLAAGGMLELYGGAQVIMEPLAGRKPALVVTSPACVHVFGGAEGEPVEFAASVDCRSDAWLLVEESAKLNLTGVTQVGNGVLDPSGAGSVWMDEATSVTFSNDFFCAGGLSGSGTVRFLADPTRSMVSPWLQDAAWRGECLVDGAELIDFDPAACGNVASSVAFRQCHGYFAYNAVAPFGIRLYGNPSDEIPALKVNGGYDGVPVRLAKLFGSGRLSVGDGGIGGYGYWVQPDDISGFTGALEVEAGAGGSILLDDGSAGASPLDSGDVGMVVVRAGEWPMLPGSWWKAVAGIRVESLATVVDSGELRSTVFGDGTVRYVGALPPTRPEALARFFDAGNWRGTVSIRDGVLVNQDLYNTGNAESKLELSNVRGSIAPQFCAPTVELVGAGLGIDSAQADGMVEFAALEGDGTLRIETDEDSSGSTYSFRKVEDFVGAFRLDSEYTSVLFGQEAFRIDDGTLVFGEGVRIRPSKGWAASHVAFGERLTTAGFRDGDVIVKATDDSDVYLEHVKVNIEESPDLDPRQRYGLSFNRDTRQVTLEKAETPPDMEIGDVRIKYGVDFTNVAVRVAVTNYWEGYKFNGKTLAHVLIYDANGRLVGARECLIDGNGDYYVGGADLPFGPGSDYHFEVAITTEERDTGESTERSSSSSNAAAVRPYAADWFYENAESFSAEAPSSLKTGTWFYESGAIVTNDERQLVIDTEGADVAFAGFEPYDQVSGGYARIHFGEAVFETMQDFGAGDGGYVDIGGGIAAVTLACDYTPEVPEPYFAVWVCDERDSTTGSFVRVSGAVTPEVGVRYTVECAINRARRSISYLIDGCVMTNREGRAIFPLPAAAVRDNYSLLFRGQGRVVEVLGNQNNANLAAVVNGNVTSEYVTVDAAVAAATNAGDRVVLLWDASWRPLADDVGRTVSISCGDYVLYVDEASTNRMAGGGYRFIDNQNGSYTIGVIDYELSFMPVDASGFMPPQKFSVTNMVFCLMSNAFVRAGSDFSHWNDKENGRGLNSWTDGGIIDMSEFGLADKKIYAQWKVALNTIVIEPADEYVYVDSVTTNGQDVASVRYFAHADSAERTKGRGSAQIKVEYGATLVVRFSTDIGKTMTTPDWQVDPGFRQYSDITNSFRVANIGVNLPHYTNDVERTEAPAPLTEVECWAIVHGIPLQVAAESPFALASAKLNMNSLLNEDTEVVISDFKLGNGRCTFKVTIDGEPLEDANLIKPMIRVTGDLNQVGEWPVVDVDKVHVGEDGMVTVDTDENSSFVKIVIK